MVGETSVTVAKVGGSLLEGRGDLRRVAAAIGERRLDGGSLLVIASALKGVTDLLDQAATQARDRRLHNGHLGETLERLRRRHVEMAADVADDGSALIRVRGARRGGGAGRRHRHGRRALRRGLCPAAVLWRAAERHPAGGRHSGRRARGAAGRGRRGGPAGGRAAARGIVRPPGERAWFPPPAARPARPGPGADRLLRGRRRRRRRPLRARRQRRHRLRRGGGPRRRPPGALEGRPGLDVRRSAGGPRRPGDPRGLVRRGGPVGGLRRPVVHHGCLEPLRGRATQVFLSTVPGGGPASGTRLVERLQRDAARVVALASRRGGEGSPALVGVVGDGVADHPEIRSRVLACLLAAGAAAATWRPSRPGAPA